MGNPLAGSFLSLSATTAAVSEMPRASPEKLTPAEEEMKKKENKQELEKRYPKNVSGTVSSDEKDGQGGKKKQNQALIARRQLKQISCEEVGRVNRPIEDEPYYHGFMTRVEADKLLKREGEFLGSSVLSSSSNRRIQFGRRTSADTCTTF